MWNNSIAPSKSTKNLTALVPRACHLPSFWAILLSSPLLYSTSAVGLFLSSAAACPKEINPTHIPLLIFPARAPSFILPMLRVVKLAIKLIFILQVKKFFIKKYTCASENLENKRERCKSCFLGENKEYTDR